MDWEKLGYSDDPFNHKPISESNLDLFVGHDKEVKLCKKIVNGKNSIITVEGAKGVGTTSFSNYVRFSLKKDKLAFTPLKEISVDPNWNSEMFLASIIGAIVRELEFNYYNKLKNNKKFIDSLSLTNRISETYLNLGGQGLSFGLNYGKNKAESQPQLIPTNILGYHLLDLALIVKELGYKNGIIIQLNNLDINVVHKETDLAHLLNAVRDYFQIDYISWILVGAVGLNSFLARKVDRLDDIISYKEILNPIEKKEFGLIIKKRLDAFRISNNAIIPFAADVYDYLYDICQGRLRYVFNLINMIGNVLDLDVFSNTINLTTVQKIVLNIVKDRIEKKKITQNEENIIKILVEKERLTVQDISRQSGKSQPNISRTLSKLMYLNLVEVEQESTSRYYSPSLDAKIAFTRSCKVR